MNKFKVQLKKNEGDIEVSLLESKEGLYEQIGRAVRNNMQDAIRKAVDFSDEYDCTIEDKTMN